MSDPRPAVSSASSSADPKSASTESWPGGWYVYESGKVAGPYTAEQTFALDAVAADGKPRMVSRKGFSQWYALKDLSEIFRITKDLGKRASTELQSAKDSLERARALYPTSATAELASPSPAATNPVKPSAASAAAPSTSLPTPAAQPSAPAHLPAKAREQTPSRQVKETSSAANPSPIPNVGKTESIQAAPSGNAAAASVDPSLRSAFSHIAYAPPASRVQQRKLNSKTAKTAKPSSPTASSQPSPAAASLAPRAEEVTQVSLRSAPSASPPPSTPKPRSFEASKLNKTSSSSAAPTATLMHEYFIQRPRLHLGKLRNAWMSAFVGLPLSAGLYWPLWYRELAHEIAAHGQAKKLPSIYAVFALVPGLHVFMVLRLARSLVEMEAQNRYRSVSPATAALLALFPPFAMAYLQEAANRHWLLHARHALARRSELETTASS